MKRENISEALGKISTRHVEEAVAFNTEKKRKPRMPWIRWASAAACLVLLAGVSLWLFVPEMGSSEQVEISTVIKLGDGYTASYTKVNDMSNFDRLTLEGRIGELFLETDTQKFYKIKGQDDIARLIVVQHDGEVSLFRFSCMHGPENEDRLFSFGFVLESIYHVKSADDIKSVRFEKADRSKSGIAKKVKVKTVTVTDQAQIERLFEILKALQDTEISFTEYINQHSKEYLSGALPLSAQIQRRVTIEFENGTSMELLFDPQYKYLWRGGGNRFEGFSGEDLDWLIGLARINMQHVDYGTDEDEVKGGDGAETASRPPAP